MAASDSSMWDFFDSFHPAHAFAYFCRKTVQEETVQLQSQVTHYDVLGIRPSANDATLRRAYRRMALKTHPDKVRDKEKDKAAATAEFIRVGAAYEILIDADKRRKYDFMLQRGTRVHTRMSLRRAEDIFSDVFHDLQEVTLYLGSELQAGVESLTSSSKSRLIDSRSNASRITTTRATPSTSSSGSSAAHAASIRRSRRAPGKHSRGPRGGAELSNCSLGRVQSTSSSTIPSPRGKDACGGTKHKTSTAQLRWSTTAPRPRASPHREEKAWVAQSAYRPLFTKAPAGRPHASSEHGGAVEQSGTPRDESDVDASLPTFTAVMRQVLAEEVESSPSTGTSWASDSPTLSGRTPWADSCSRRDQSFPESPPAASTLDPFLLDNHRVGEDNRRTDDAATQPQRVARADHPDFLLLDDSCTLEGDTKAGTVTNEGKRQRRRRRHQRRVERESRRWTPVIEERQVSPQEWLHPVVSPQNTRRVAIGNGRPQQCGASGMVAQNRRLAVD
eukprot:GEMP01016436.1.p1 GENE.GEMP01016436.1~~GEMP01016436.1.p1  ORF type:complete len:504 (+),score=114.08 GEMP01016436.1:161-1672(+)